MADFSVGPKGSDYFVTRALLLRSLGVIYFVAFAILVQQGGPLLGSHGLLPLAAYLEEASRHFDGFASIWRLPTLFWLGSSDAVLEGAAWTGLMLSTLVVLGVANAPILGALWLLYLSFVQAGQIFYGYGWEMLLCEAGFLAMFLAPSLRPALFSAKDPPPLLLIVLFRCLTFRLMFGAGLIKMRGDPCWAELTCLDFHYETQPNPSPLSPFFHFAPRFTHTTGVVVNHVAELIAPFGVFGPRRVRLVAGSVIVGFLALLILSGNLSFLNWLSIVVAIACFDDRALARFTPANVLDELKRVRDGVLEPSRARRITLVALGIVIFLLSLNPVVNLLSQRQRMTASFDPLGLVWSEYEFPCKPGNVHRAPCLVTPYHYRLAWQLWFAALTDFEREPWIVHLAYKLLRGDRSIAPLVLHDPFPDRPPRYVRALLYRYRFAPLGERGVYWHRELEGEYLKPLWLGHRDFERFLQSYGWLERTSAR